MPVGGYDIFQLGQIVFGCPGQVRPFIPDPSQKHGLRRIQRYSYDLFAVKVLIIDTGADGISVQADDKIENRGPVADIDLFA